jgi:hypothetical protein
LWLRSESVEPVRPPRSYEPQVGGMGCLFGGIVVRDVLVKLIEYCIEKND